MPNLSRHICQKKLWNTQSRQIKNIHLGEIRTEAKKTGIVFRTV